MNLFDRRVLANVQKTAKWLSDAEGDKQLEFAQLQQQLVAKPMRVMSLLIRSGSILIRHGTLIRSAFVHSMFSR